MIIIAHAPHPVAHGMLAANLARTAMTEGSCVRFDYDGKSRLVEVHAIGLGRKNNYLLRGVQVGGEARRPLPQWTLFDLSKVEAMFIADHIPSGAPRAGYSMGDKQMSPVLTEIQS